MLLPRALDEIDCTGGLDVGELLPRPPRRLAAPAASERAGRSRPDARARRPRSVPAHPSGKERTTGTTRASRHESLAWRPHAASTAVHQHHELGEVRVLAIEVLAAALDELAARARDLCPATTR